MNFNYDLLPIQNNNLAFIYNVPITTIWKIIHGTYFAIKHCSLITEETFQQLKQLKQKLQGEKLRKYNKETENFIINDYNNGLTITVISKKYLLSSPTISKILKNNNIIIEKIEEQVNERV